MIDTINGTSFNILNANYSDEYEEYRLEIEKLKKSGNPHPIPFEPTKYYSFLPTKKKMIYSKSKKEIEFYDKSKLNELNPSKNLIYIVVVKKCELQYYPVTFYLNRYE